MKKQPLTKEQLLSDDEGPDYLDVMKKQLKKAQALVMANNKYLPEKNKWHVQRNTLQANYRQDKIYTLFTADAPTHFQTHWTHIQKLYPRHKNKVVNLATKRIKAVMKDLLRDNIRIEERQPLLPFNYDQYGKMETLRQHSLDLRKKLQDINSSLEEVDMDKSQKQFNSNDKDMFAHLYSQEKLKATQAFIQQQKKEKQERRKKIEEERKRHMQQQQKAEQQKREIEEKKAKEIKNQFIKKQMELKKRREQQKGLRQQRNSEYLRVKKQMKQQPRLFQRLLKSYSERRQYYESQMKQQAKLEKKKNRYMHIDEMGLDQHEKEYQEIRRRKEEQRQKKFEQYLKQEEKSRVRHSSYELQRPVDRSQIERQQAKQRLSKMKQYEMLVKQKYQPKIDEQKRKEMQSIIEEIQLNSRKKVKKKVLEDGKILYEEIKQVDSRDIGMKYLEMTKQMAAKARALKGNSSDKDQPLPPSEKKTFDYLEHFRKNPRPKPSRLSFINKNSLSYEQKMQKVLVESEKLAASTKTNEDKLKYGKFKTSQQILDCKEEIDQNYIDLAFMKLKMIKEKGGQ